MNKVLAMGLGILMLSSFSLHVSAKEIIGERGQFGRPTVVGYESEEDITEEIKLGEMELISQLVEAEAGNQPYEGKCLVVDVILNRVDSPDWPNTISEVIFQDKQFSVVRNGAFERAAYHMKEDDYSCVVQEMENRTNLDVLYFNNSSSVSGKGTPFKVGDHWFNY